ncbi:MAG: DM13 domain-containing protein [Chloroflexi bacterium]|nr:DM13 domain-containing protein [Chloroflexota bacterium]MCH8108847.1 DM13 domain-containing protein [Chloroflexota bacterium]
MGNQNYTIPDNVDIAALGSIVIYCAPFHVIFSVASLGDAG